MSHPEQSASHQQRAYNHHQQELREMAFDVIDVMPCVHDEKTLFMQRLTSIGLTALNQ
ncbi:hypothetical protein [Methylophilus aquaticus]|uniref:Uncharacterized protein n=1 Tax=Methylophilus aquaticus TaxID=1971610 RepID=A0ABT9JRZ9_9PROT|nr:hypothetical protein [Methylophilus aquaticus]MDP8567346.1 hypothetical protein [Methylophilus aquaticus]